MVFMASPVLNNFPRVSRQPQRLMWIMRRVTELVFRDDRSLSTIATLH